MKSMLQGLVSLSLLLVCLLCEASQLRILNSKTLAASPKPADNATRTKVNEVYGRLPLSFEINRGQADATVRFLSTGANYSIHLRQDEVRLSLDGAESNNKGISGDCGAQTARTHTPVTVKFINANPSPQMEGMDELPGKSNYIIGSDPKNWLTDIPTYAKIRYREVWPGVGAVFYGSQRRLEYDFVVAPGADPRAIKLSLDGAKKISVDANGDLILRLAEGELRQLKPVVYQDVKGVRRTVNGRYVVRGDRVGFEIGRYDRSRELVIDPVLNYLARIPAGRSVAVDAQGNAYITAEVARNNDIDLAVMKLNAAGTELIYNTVIGGSEADSPEEIAVDAAGNAYVVGTTPSTDFPGGFPGASPKGGAGVFFKSVDGGVVWELGGVGLKKRHMRFDTLLVDPNNPLVFFASATGGDSRDLIFKSVNSGDTWTSLSQNLGDVINPRLLAIQGGATTTIYASANDGLLKSMDGGATWSQAGLKDVGRLNFLVVDQQNPSNLYAATSSQIYRSADGGANWQAANNGIPNSPPPNFPPSSPTIIHLTGDRKTPSTLYTVVSFAGVPRAIYRTTDGALNWSQIRSDFSLSPIRMVTVDPSDSAKLFVVADNGLFKSGDGGQSWSPAGLTNLFVSMILIDPTNPATIYAAAPRRSVPPSVTGGGVPGVYKSVDGGVSWSQFDHRLRRMPVTTLAFNPLNTSALFAFTESYTETFALKLNPAGSELNYANYFGPGSGESIAVDANANVFVTGSILSGSPDAQIGDGEAVSFVARLSGSGERSDFNFTLAARTYDLAIDSGGMLYLTGGVDNGSSLPIKDGFQGQFSGNAAAFLARLDPGKAVADALLYSTYLDFSGAGIAVAVDGNGRASVLGGISGNISDPQFTNRPFLQRGSYFVAKLDTTRIGAASMLWSAELAQGNYSDIAADSGGAIYLVGSAGSGYPVTPGALQNTFAGGNCMVAPVPTCNCPLVFGFCPLRCQLPPPPTNTATCSDGFVTKINADGTALLYSTYLGSATTSLSETATDVTVDAAGNVYVIGVANLSATPGALQSNGGGFITKLTIDARNASVAAVSAASYQGPQLAQESLAVGFLNAFGAGAENLRARVKDSAGIERDAPVFFSGFGQVNFQIPPETAIGDALINVTSVGGVIANGALQIVKVAPGVFSADASGGGLVAAVALRQKPDNTQTYEPVIRFDPALNKIVAVPIDLGPEGDRVFLAIFGTGWRFRSSETAAKVTVGGVDVPVLYVGAQGTLRGADQINVELTRALAGKGEVDLEVMVDGKAANTTRVDIK